MTVDGKQRLLAQIKKSLDLWSVKVGTKIRTPENIPTRVKPIKIITAGDKLTL